jgi:hypothetical protein
LSEVVIPDSGEIRVKGSAFRPRTVVDAHERGVSTAFQELSLVPSLSVAVNMFLPRPEQNRAGLVSTRRLEAQAAEILQEYSVTDIRPSAVISDLPLGMRQRIEIVRAAQALRAAPRRGDCSSLRSGVAVRPRGARSAERCCNPLRQPQAGRNPPSVPPLRDLAERPQGLDI